MFFVEREEHFDSMLTDYGLNLDTANNWERQSDVV